MVLKQLIFQQFLFWGRVWWSESTDILTVSTLGLGVVVLKELIFNSFLFGRVWWLLKELISNS